MTAPAPTAFKDRLRRWRLRRGLSVNELAMLAGVSRMTVYRLEAGEYLPRWYVASKLADALGIGLEEFERDTP